MAPSLSSGDRRAMFRQRSDMTEEDTRASLGWWLYEGIFQRHSLRGWRALHPSKREWVISVAVILLIVYAVWAGIDGDAQAGCSFFHPGSCARVHG